VALVTLATPLAGYAAVFCGCSQSLAGERTAEQAAGDRNDSGQLAAVAQIRDGRAAQVRQLRQNLLRHRRRPFGHLVQQQSRVDEIRHGTERHC